MEIKKVNAVYFSPMGGSKLYAEMLAGALSQKAEPLDLTDKEARARSYSFSAGDVVIVSAPVYAGRLPRIEGGIFERLKGDNTPAVCLVTYGNRDYDDALLELKNIMERQGFKCITAAALIAPHTYSDKAGAGRPDEEDKKIVYALAERIKQKLSADDFKEIKVKGNFPYKEYKGVPFVPKANGKCNNCGICAKVCPAGAILEDNPKATIKGKCLACFACVKKCPQKARDIGRIFKFLIKKMEKNWLLENKKADVFTD